VEAERHAQASLLSACRVHGDAGVGERVAMRLLALGPATSSPYVLLSHLHASGGRWDAWRMLKGRSRKEDRMPAAAPLVSDEWSSALSRAGSAGDPPCPWSVHDAHHRSIMWRGRAGLWTCGDSCPRAGRGTCGPDATEAQVRATNLGRPTPCCAVHRQIHSTTSRRTVGAPSKHAKAVACPPTNPASALAAAATAGSPPGHLTSSARNHGRRRAWETFAPVNSSCPAASPRSEIPVRPDPVNLKFPHD
jgi:hypothetical protein